MTNLDYCKSTLRRVSRTFALNIAFLRGDLHKSILTAYLFCRIADTIEDTIFRDSSTQKALLDSYKNIFDSGSVTVEKTLSWIADYHAAAKTINSTDDHNLVSNAERVIELYLTLPDPYQEAVNECIHEMATGMLCTLERKENQPSKLFFSKTIEDLNKYCYYVAGTVGVLLSRLFFVHSQAITRHIWENLKDRAVSFGLGLQLTNIIKDCWVDQKRGWCYIPEELVRQSGIDPDDFFLPQHRLKAQLTINELIQRAANHLDEALTYTLTIPRREVRIRLFCLLPLLLAIQTLIEAKDNLKLFTDDKVKISRLQVKKTIRNAFFFCWSNQAISNYYNSFRKQLQQQSA